MLLRNLSTFLKQADSRIREARFAHPGAFWAVVVAIVPVAIGVAVAPLIWKGYSTNREDIAPIATFIGAAVVAYAALKQAATASRRHFAQTEADRQRRIVESFTKAVEQLGSDKLEVRVGAIFALERISRESPDDYWTIMEVLAAFVRDRMRYTTVMARLSERAYFVWLQAGRPEGRSEEFWREAVRLERLEQTPTDAAAIFTVIMRRSDNNRQREKDARWRLDLSGTYLPAAYLEKIYLSGADLSEAHLEGAWLMQANFEKAYLVDAHFKGADLRDARLEKATLDGAQFEGADLREAHLKGAKLVGAHLKEANLAGAHLKRADLTDAHFEGANLMGAHLEGAKLRETHLEGAKLRAAHLDAAYLWYAHLQGADLKGAHLKRATLQGVYLERANLWDAHLEGATLWDAHLEEAILWDAHLDGADFQEAHLERAQFWGAHLEGANLLGTHLEGALLLEAHLEGADLRDANGLTDDQLLKTFGDAETKLPEGMTPPKHWSALKTQAG